VRFIGVKKRQDAHLFSPLAMRDVQFRNRIVVWPMCQARSA
jgi:2,4-dienoyl-CoA reductase-like NADH-dependent reductase (Old Yellow Enzyme family)